jgi:hypothetical protein
MAVRAFFSTEFRRKIWLRDQGVCGVCKQPVAFDSDMHVDHIVQICMGGGNEESNLRASHALCNWTREKRRIPSTRPKTPIWRLLLLWVEAAWTLRDLRANPANTIVRHSNRWLVRHTSGAEVSFIWRDHRAQDIRLEQIPA